MANAIDDIGAKVVGDRMRGETDEDYALRVLQTLYRTHEALNAPGWVCFDRETNEYTLGSDTYSGLAKIARGKGCWKYTAVRDGRTLIVGEARYLEKAMQICSLVLS